MELLERLFCPAAALGSAPVVSWQNSDNKQTPCPVAAPLQALGWALYSSALVACLYLLVQAVAGVAYW